MAHINLGCRFLRFASFEIALFALYYRIRNHLFFLCMKPGHRGSDFFCTGCFCEICLFSSSEKIGRWTNERPKRVIWGVQLPTFSFLMHSTVLRGDLRCWWVMRGKCEIFYHSHVRFCPPVALTGKAAAEIQWRRLVAAWPPKQPLLRRRVLTTWPPRRPMAELDVTSRVTTAT